MTSNQSVPPYYVFFDVDETLIKCKSMVEFMEYFLMDINHVFTIANLNQKRKTFKAIIIENQKKNSNRQALNRDFYKLFSGIKRSYLSECARNWVKDKIDKHDLFIQATLKRYRDHKKDGATIVLVSASFLEILLPIKDCIQADHLICSELEVVNDNYTGNLDQQVIGEKKWLYISKYLNKKNVNLKHCYAYGDHESDIHFMDKVGFPVVVNGSCFLRNYAVSHQWEIITT